MVTTSGHKRAISEGESEQEKISRRTQKHLISEKKALKDLKALEGKIIAHMNVGEELPMKIHKFKTNCALTKLYCGRGRPREGMTTKREGGTQKGMRGGNRLTSL